MIYLLAARTPRGKMVLHPKWARQETDGDLRMQQIRQKKRYYRCLTEESRLLCGEVPSSIFRLIIPPTPNTKNTSVINTH